MPNTGKGLGGRCSMRDGMSDWKPAAKPSRWREIRCRIAATRARGESSQANTSGFTSGVLMVGVGCSRRRGLASRVSRLK